MKQKLFECVGPNQFKLAEKKISDPTKEEMLHFLASQFGREEGFEGDAEAAMYWFANFNHGGQSSNLYSVLSTSQFSPGPISKGPQPNSAEEMMYQALESEFGSGKQVHEDGGGAAPAGAGGGTGMGMSVTGAVQGYSTPKAFSKRKLGEEEQPEMYDDKTDQFAPGPRQRPEDWQQPTQLKDLVPQKPVNENPAPYYDRLDQALKAVEEYIIKNTIQVDPTEHHQDPTDPGLSQTDPYRIREPFLYGGISYGQTKNADYKLAAFKGKPTKKYLHVSIRRTEQGRYELNVYVL